MKQLHLLTVIRQDIDPLSRAVWKSRVLYSCCYEEGHKEKPFVMVDNNKIILNQTAFETIETIPGDRFDITYRQEGLVIYPCLINKTRLNQEGGNKLTKSMTISFRGTVHDQLVKYGMIFHLVEYKDKTMFDLIPMDKTDNNSSLGTIVEHSSDLDENIIKTTDQTEYSFKLENIENNDNKVVQEIDNENELDEFLKSL